MAAITLNKKMLTKAGSIVTPVLIDGSIVQCLDQYGGIGYYSLADLFSIVKSIETPATITPAALTMISTNNSSKIMNALPVIEKNPSVPVESISHSIEMADGKLDVTMSGKYNYTAPSAILVIDLNISSVYSVNRKSRITETSDEEMIIVLPKEIPIVSTLSKSTKKNIYISNEEYV